MLAARVVLLAVFPLVLVACGGRSPEDRVRDTARAAAEAMTSSHPERACKYMVDRDGCVGSVALANSLHLEVAAAVGIPDDWRSRLRDARIKVSGDEATIADWTGDGKPGRYVRRHGEWLVDNR